MRQHVEQLAAGLPGARLFVLAAAPDVPLLTDLLRLAHALDLAAVLTYCDHRLDAGDPLKIQGEQWDVRVLARDAQVGAVPPGYGSVEAAVGRCVEHLDSHLLAAVPREPDQPVVTAFDRTGCRLWLTDDGLQPLAQAATLDAAVSALRL
ncbi:hypothetical protein Jiend_43420 [Micromonospora endophytica]|nr:hypothetical protein Jiend_43420 [Micromonospora endophytica]